MTSFLVMRSDGHAVSGLNLPARRAQQLVANAVAVNNLFPVFFLPPGFLLFLLVKVRQGLTSILDDFNVTTDKGQ